MTDNGNFVNEQPRGERLVALAETESRFPGLLKAKSAGNASWPKVLLVLLIFLLPVMYFVFGPLFTRLATGAPANLNTSPDAVVWRVYAAQLEVDEYSHTTISYSQFSQYHFDVYRGNDFPDDMNGKEFVNHLSKLNPKATIYSRVYQRASEAILMFAVVSPEFPDPVFYRGLRR